MTEPWMEFSFNLALAWQLVIKLDFSNLVLKDFTSRFTDLFCCFIRTNKYDKVYDWVSTLLQKKLFSLRCLE
jgi:hypothetical protein